VHIGLFIAITNLSK